MQTMPYQKYRPYAAIDLPSRTWPSRTITHAPAWCSVDLRDGNQALAIPMGVEKKLEFFQLLLDLGFKEIEMGFPAASQAEFDFLRLVIEKKLIPSDVTIQVLTPAREELIARTVAAVAGAGRVVLHLYNSTSELQRRVVFRMDEAEIVGLAVRGAKALRKEATRLRGADVVFEYSPESFTGTEPEFGLEICEAVAEVWQPATANPIILNLPATVEMSLPNRYADLIEWFCGKVSNRKERIISVHAHNDRGTAVAATELALLAGADRVEGTLFGNGERTGNVDLVTLGLNLFSQGVDPRLDLRDLDRIIEVYRRCTGMPVASRHPYAGELVYTAFSGSHQDAINKGLKARSSDPTDRWEVPYLPVDPADLGRSYEGVIRINSQSGKGGVAYVLEKEYGFFLPREMTPEVSRVVQAVSERSGREVSPDEIRDAFTREFIERRDPLSLVHCAITDQAGGTHVAARIVMSGVSRDITGTGNGPVDAFCNALKHAIGIDFDLDSYHEHALGQGSDSRAVAYVRVRDNAAGACFGAAIDTNIAIASLKAVVAAVNRLLGIREQTNRAAAE